MTSDDLEPGAKRVVLRPHSWRRREVLAVLLFVPYSIGTWVREPDPGPLWVLLLVAALLVAAQWPAKIWLVITDGDVTYSTRHAFERKPETRRAMREEVSAVDLWRDQLVLSGESGRTVLSLRPDWTLAQCGDIAARLDVPVVRHKGRKGR